MTVVLGRFDDGIQAALRRRLRLGTTRESGDLASLVLAGLVVNNVLVLLSTFTFVLSLVRVFTREDFDREHSLAYRIGNWGGAVIAVAIGLLMIAVGIVSFNTFA